MRFLRWQADERTMIGMWPMSLLRRLRRSVPILHHDIQVQGPLVCEALHAQAM